MTEANDQALLALYLRGADDAFGELLRRHAGLVYGTALRATGDQGAAEEISQDVFVLLARKARQLVRHQSVAGWLHRTSRNIARHAIRSRARRDRKVAEFASANVSSTIDPGPSPDSPALLDEAIQHLPRSEREAVLLRFIEDHDYSEIADRLDVSEAAARKRVSRGLRRLQERLGESKASHASTGLLAVAAPGPLLETISSSLPAATSTGASSLVLVMTTNTTLKVAAIGIAGGALLFTNIQQHRTNTRLKTELDAARLELKQLRSHPLGSSSGTGESRSDQPAGGASTATGTGDAAELTAALERERQQREAAEEKVAALEAELAPLQEEVVVAYGKVGEIGRDFGSLFRDARFLADMEKEGRLEEPEIKKRLVEFFQSAATMSGLSAQIVEFESDPEEGAEFFSSTYAELFDLDDATRDNLHGIFARHIPEAKERGIHLQELRNAALEAAPDEKVGRILRERQDYFRAVRAELREAVPEEHHEDFDAWVESDGIGFNNFKLGGQTLQFSLGGGGSDPGRRPGEQDEAQGGPEQAGESE